MPDTTPPAHAAARIYRRSLRALDLATDALALGGLVVLVLVVSWQVFSRYVLGSTPGWSSETALLLLVWIAFLGIPKGIRADSHIALGFVVDRFPAAVRAVVARFSALLMLVLGVFLVVQGSEFTQLMANSTMPATGLPTSVQYAAMPVAGVLITLYSTFQLFGLMALPGSRESEAESAADSAGESGER